MKQYCFYQNYREVRLLVIHCSATRYDRDFPVEALRGAHKDRGFADIGYHYISPGMASCTAAGRRTRSGHTPRAGTITVWVFATRADWMSEVFPLIPEPTPSVVPCSISCGSYAVITRRHVS